MKKKLMITSTIIIFSLLIWWSYFMFFVPHFHEGPNNTLVSKNVTLELVTTSPEPEKEGITVPDFLPFWKVIGEVDGKGAGDLWEFTDNGKKYVVYSGNEEMAGRYIYKYSKK